MTERFNPLITWLEREGSTEVADELRALRDNWDQRGMLPASSLLKPEEFAVGSKIEHSQFALFPRERRMRLPDGTDVGFTNLETRTLTALLGNVNRVTRYRELVSTVWGKEHLLGSQDVATILNHVKTIRDKFKTIGLDPSLIENHFGVGYSLKDPRKAGDPVAEFQIKEPQMPQEVYDLGAVHFYPDRLRQIVRDDGVEKHLQLKESMILLILCRNRGSVVFHSRILDFAWGEGEGSADLLRVHVSRIRTKIADSGKGKSAMIKSVINLGYVLMNPNSSDEAV